MNEIMRKNGRKYTTKDDKNRFFFPKDYLIVYDLLKKKQQHTAMCLINTGARINEMRNVKINHINWDGNFITLKTTKTKAKKGESKGRPRYIKISTQFAKYLKRYIRKNKIKGESDMNILSTPAFNIGIKKACKMAKLSHPNDFSAHILRKSMETWLMALNVDSLKILVHLGHDARTAARSYINPDIFTAEQKFCMREILGDLYER